MILRPGFVARIMAIATILLVAASIGMQVFAHLTGFHTMHGLVRFFTLDAENNLPTWYSSATLLFAAFLLATIASAEKRAGGRSRHWLGLSAVFVILSMDEVGSFHEIFIAPVRSLFSVDGLLHFAWVLPAGALVAILAVLYAAWFFRLPARTRLLMALSGALYLGGALGLEMLGGLLVSRGQLHSPIYVALATCEEAAEMCGVLLWVYSLLDYARSRRYEATITFSERNAERAAAHSD